MDEAGTAADVLGASAAVLEPGPVETRHFGESRQYILQSLVTLGREIQPDLVLCPSSFNFHQDHEVVTAEARRAFRTCTILGYELPWSCHWFEANCSVQIEEQQLLTKIKAMECYKSQREKAYMDAVFIESMARVRGVQAGCELAEAFEVIRWVM